MINLMTVLIGFFSKQFVLYSALQNGYFFISIIAIIVSVISASYYLKIIKVLHTDPSSLAEQKPAWGNPIKVGVESRVGGTLSHSSSPMLHILLVALARLGPRPTRVVLLKLHQHKPWPGRWPRPTKPWLAQLRRLPLLEPSKSTLTNTHSFLISSLTLIILLFFIKPSIILTSTQLLSLSLFYI
jgi:NADH-ubiquinone oxidoreductase chain 2